MSPSQKMTFFRMLVGVGFKEIEVAYPAASDLDFAFVRKVVEDGEAGDDVFIQVCRPRCGPRAEVGEAGGGRHAQAAVLHELANLACLAEWRR